MVSLDRKTTIETILAGGKVDRITFQLFNMKVYKCKFWFIKHVEQIINRWLIVSLIIKSNSSLLYAHAQQFSSFVIYSHK